jgi:hypothetical protein
MGQHGDAAEQGWRLIKEFLICKLPVLHMVMAPLEAAHTPPLQKITGDRNNQNILAQGICRRNQVEPQHGECHFFCSDKQRGYETQQSNPFICLKMKITSD